MFRRLISFEEAVNSIKDHCPLKPVGIESVLLREASGRVLAEDVISDLDIPPFDRSTVDGYAVRSEDTYGVDDENPKVLKICGEIKIGETPRVSVRVGEAAQIPTGAPIPEGADAVVMVEYTVTRKDRVEVFRPVYRGENIMRKGTDVSKGELVLKRGETLTPAYIGVLAAIGKERVNIYARPKIAILSTGPEIVVPGKPLPYGKIYDINSYTLATAAKEVGCEVVYVAVVPDEESKIEKELKRTLEKADVVLTSGGVSVGPMDLLPKVLSRLSGKELVFSGVAIKPGKPTTFAVIEGKPVFSLPGHPTSALTIFYLFVRPLLLRLMGREAEAFKVVKANAGLKMFPAKGRRTFVMVKLLKKEDNLIAYPVPTGQSGAITTLAKADGFVIIHEKRQFISEGEEVEVHLFS